MSKPEITAIQSIDIIKIENQNIDEINTQPSPREKRKWTPHFLKSNKSPAPHVKKKNPSIMQEKFSKNWKSSFPNPKSSFNNISTTYLGFIKKLFSIILRFS
ncbi:hypothetical protein QE152_g22293 [Popillia japonica]|uniref:Uncharacterized protein n=1 Tax=Popillia japonica TaxID=7064 RepID=A0AAW1KKQ5_POPJA